MAYQLAPLPKRAKKFIAVQTAKQRKAIYAALAQIQESPQKHTNPTTIRPLKGARKGQWRYRLGDIRIIYLVHSEKELIQVLNIARRGGAYRTP